MLLSLFKPRSRTECAVQLQDGTRFSVRAGITLLDAALSAGLDAPYNCRVGACRTCRCEVLQGEAKSLVDRAYVLDPQDVRRGVYLACQTQALSDLVLRWEMGCHQESTLPATVSGLRRLTPRVWRVSLTTARALHALPGQYIGLHVQDANGEPCLRQYSIVSLQPSAAGSMLHIDVARHVGGRMSGWLTEQNALGRTVEIAGPFGDCVAGDGASPLAAVGAGSGIGAACGALMHSHAQHPHRPTLLLAYGATAQDLYGADEVAASAQRSGTRHISLAWAENLPTTNASVACGRAPQGLDAIASWATPSPRGVTGASADARVLLYGPSGFVDACLTVLHDMNMGREQVCFDRYLICNDATAPGRSIDVAHAAVTARG